MVVAEVRIFADATNSSRKLPPTATSGSSFPSFGMSAQPDGTLCARGTGSMTCGLAVTESDAAPAPPASTARMRKV